MQNQLVRQGQQDIVREGAFDLTPRSLSEAIQLAEMMGKSALVPEQFRNKPGDILIAVQYGAEVGLKPLQSLQGIAVINGRPTIWGDAALGVVLNSGLMENYKEMTLEEIEAAGKAVFWGKRKGVHEPIVREFSIQDAKRAHLWENPRKSPWVEHKFRMLQMRARSWGLRDGWADVLKGLSIREEVEDFEAIQAPHVLAMPRRKSELPEAPPEYAQPEPVQESAMPEEAPQNTEPQAEPQEQPAPKSGRKITDAQRKRMYAIARGAGFNDKEFEETLRKEGYDSSKDVTMDDYDRVVKIFEEAH